MRFAVIWEVWTTANKVGDFRKITFFDRIHNKNHFLLWIFYFFAI